jgi:hypothetical protein
MDAPSSIETSSEFWSARDSVALTSDPDLHRIYFTGKNDTTIHFFDLTDDRNGLSRPEIATFFDTLSIDGSPSRWPAQSPTPSTGLTPPLQDTFVAVSFHPLLMNRELGCCTLLSVEVSVA